MSQKPKNGGLNEKQKAFCNEYIIDLNGTQAAIRAGYSKKTAGSQANAFLKKPEIQQYLQELMAGIAKRNRISQDEIMRDLIEIKNRCLQNVPVMKYNKETKEYEQEGAGCGEPIYKFDGQSAIKALDALCKIIGAYEKDNQQKANAGTDVNIIINKADFEEVRNDTENMFDE